jgi:hypothetical protein
VTRFQIYGALGILTAFWAACSVVEEPSDDDGRFGESSASTVTTAQQGVGGSSVADSGAGASSSSTASSQGGASTVTGTASSTIGSGGACPDTSAEPNNTEGEATSLGVLDDCDEVGFTVKGVLAGSDVDWYTYDGKDKFGCIMEPARAVSTNQQVRICKFFDCAGVSLTCPSGTSDDTSPNGYPGCCSVNGFTVAPDCNGASDDATVYIRIDKPPSFPCVTYDLSFHY